MTSTWQEATQCQLHSVCNNRLLVYISVCLTKYKSRDGDSFKNFRVTVKRFVSQVGINGCLSWMVAISSSLKKVSQEVNVSRNVCLKKCVKKCLSQEMSVSSSVSRSLHALSRYFMIEELLSHRIVTKLHLYFFYILFKIFILSFPSTLVTHLKGKAASLIV